MLHFCESVCAIVRVVATGVKVTVVNAAAGFPASFFGLAFLVAGLEVCFLGSFG